MPRDRRLLLAVLIGGTFGTVLRAALEGVGGWTPASGGWPWATLGANLAGALLLGLLAGRRGGPPTSRPAARRHALLGAGLCGGLTTFSTLQLEVVLLVRAGTTGSAAGYLLASVLGGLLVAWVGLRLGRAVDRAPGAAA